MNLRYTPQSIADLQEIMDYIGNILHGPAAAKRIVRSVLNGCASLKEFPEMGVSLAAKTGFETDLRMLICGQYAVLYRVDKGANAVSVARIIHARQDYIRILLGESGPAGQEGFSE